MTAHELAKALLAGPDLPVIINGWGSDEGFAYEASPGAPMDLVFHGETDDRNTPRDDLGWKLPRPAIALGHCANRDWL